MRIHHHPICLSWLTCGFVIRFPPLLPFSAAENGQPTETASKQFQVQVVDVIHRKLHRSSHLPTGKRISYRIVATQPASVTNNRM